MAASSKSGRRYDPKRFRANLRNCLSSRRMTQRALAEALHVGPRTVRRWITGHLPAKTRRQALAALLGVAPDWLESGDGPPLVSEAPESYNPAAGAEGAMVAGGIAGAAIKTSDAIQRIAWRNQTLLVTNEAPRAWDVALLTLQSGQQVLGRILHVQKDNEERVSCWPVEGDRTAPPMGSYRSDEIVTMKRALGVLF